MPVWGHVQTPVVWLYCEVTPTPSCIWYSIIPLVVLNITISPVSIFELGLLKVLEEKLLGLI